MQGQSDNAPADLETDRELILGKMQRASDTFYRLAVWSECHSFVEFTGLMNEFIKICRQSLQDGIPFEQASTHSGVALAMQPFHAAYLAEKLNCIYGMSLLAKQEVRDVFVDVLFEGQYTLVPRRARTQILDPVQRHGNGCDHE
jgi:hypothetical protein